MVYLIFTSSDFTSPFTVALLHRVVNQYLQSINFYFLHRLLAQGCDLCQIQSSNCILYWYGLQIRSSGGFIGVSKKNRCISSLLFSLAVRYDKLVRFSFRHASNEIHSPGSYYNPCIRHTFRFSSNFCL